MSFATSLSTPLAVPARTVRPSSSRAPRRGSSLVVRASDDNQGKVVREYREDDGTMSTPGQKKNEPLYADQIPKKKGSGLSPEMEARLRKEYIGLGGSPNQAMNSNYFLYIILFVSALAVASWLTGAI